MKFSDYYNGLNESITKDEIDSMAKGDKSGNSKGLHKSITRYKDYDTKVEETSKGKFDICVYKDGKEMYTKKDFEGTAKKADEMANFLIGWLKSGKK